MRRHKRKESSNNQTDNQASRYEEWMTHTERDRVRQESCWAHGDNVTYSFGKQHVGHHGTIKVTCFFDKTRFHVTFRNRHYPIQCLFLKWDHHLPSISLLAHQRGGVVDIVDVA